VGESSFWYRPTRVVPDQRPLNGRCCHIDVNIVSLIILAPSWAAMQQLLDIFSLHACETDMVCNVKKTVCMVSAPCNKAKIVLTLFPLFKLSSSCIQYVHKFKYLGHMQDQHLSDDDVLREVSNVLCCKFSRCSINVKIQIFKSYCLRLYGTALWCCYTRSSAIAE